VNNDKIVSRHVNNEQIDTTLANTGKTHVNVCEN